MDDCCFYRHGVESEWLSTSLSTWGNAKLVWLVLDPSVDELQKLRRSILSKSIHRRVFPRRRKVASPRTGDTKILAVVIAHHHLSLPKWYREKSQYLDFWNAKTTWPEVAVPCNTRYATIPRFFYKLAAIEQLGPESLLALLFCYNPFAVVAVDIVSILPTKVERTLNTNVRVTRVGVHPPRGSPSLLSRWDVDNTHLTEAVNEGPVATFAKFDVPKRVPVKSN
mmetsp:Transcript_16451/g.30865  ORF Transcript_16451/g.30865 Transcript_16451/m.30865 type:complete len:224 (-) Transcript_16451:173-844(-)